MTAEELQELLSEVDEDIVTADGFEEAFMGLAWRCSDGPVAMYDREKCIEVIMKRDLVTSGGMTHEQAEEFFEFNVVGAWVGDRTPWFFTKVES